MDYVWKLQLQLLFVCSAYPSRKCLTEHEPKKIQVPGNGTTQSKTQNVTRESCILIGRFVGACMVSLRTPIMESKDFKELLTEWPPPQDDETPACKKFKLTQNPSSVRSGATNVSEPMVRRVLSEEELQLVCSPAETGLDCLLAKWLKWKRSCGFGSYDKELSELPTSTIPNTLLYNSTKYVDRVEIKATIKKTCHLSCQIVMLQKE